MYLVLFHGYLVSLSYFLFNIFIHLKMDLLNQFPSSNDESISFNAEYLEHNYLLNLPVRALIFESDI